MAELRYLARVLLDYVINPSRSCPHCCSDKTRLVGRKYKVLQLRQCLDCGLMFRFPKETLLHNKTFYSGLYQEQGLTTRLPTEDGLQTLLRENFRDSGKDFSPRIALLEQYKPQGSLLDFGASWGYGAWQIQRKGFNVIAFEVDAMRAAYGEQHLDLTYFTDWKQLLASRLTFDVIFTSHVLEHLPNLYTIFEEFNTLLKPDGILQIYVPNSTGVLDRGVFAQKKQFAFGQKHTIAFDAEFFAKNLPKYGFYVELISTGKDGYINQSAKDLIIDPELVVIARKSVKN